MTVLRDMLDGVNVLMIDQHTRHWWEILLNFEQRNRYEVRDSVRSRGFVEEQGASFVQRLKRVFLGSRRPLELLVTGAGDQPAMRLRRPFYFFLSDMVVEDEGGRVIGRIIKRWRIFTKTYDLFEGGRAFGRIKSRFWRVWTFPVFDSTSDQKIATISKKWGGALREYATDADKFRVEFESPMLTLQQKAVIFGAALSIDFDYFENNRG